MMSYEFSGGLDVRCWLLRYFGMVVCFRLRLRELVWIIMIVLIGLMFICLILIVIEIVQLISEML